MCRLYALRANEPTRVECSLIRAQNALIHQSRGDREGRTHPHGWGVADYKGEVPAVEKSATPADQEELFHKKVARIYAHTVIAHVRGATVGPIAQENTHPFSYGRWVFAHNGTLPRFDRLRDKLLQTTDPIQHNSIHGQTDSEYIFHYLLSLWSHKPEQDLLTTLRQGLQRIIGWCREIDAEGEIGLNVVLTDGERLVGSRFGRTLWMLERDHSFVCGICGQSHVHHQGGHHKPGNHYRSVEVASEPLTNETSWREIPEGTLYSIGPDLDVTFSQLKL